MLVSLKWLRDYLDVDLSPQELADKLTMSGLEVDSLNIKEPAFSGVKVARIVRMAPHPNADKLSLCEVSTGPVNYPVVCGAKNIKVGDTVPLATVGAILPGGQVISSTKIRGEVSEGMLCSEEELQIGSDASGIMLLPSELACGGDLAEALDLNDAVLDIGVTPNRSDCLSIIGVTREVAAITGKNVNYPDCSVVENNDDIANITSVTIEDGDLCPRYTARVIKDVCIGPSPFWLKKRLEAVGLRSINNIVDITNFVMMETGQPLHAFDFALLAGGKIVVRRSRAGENFVSLDGKERLLPAEALLICDAEKPVAIAGVMGGINSEVKDDTKTILLESAYFNPSSIRRTARSMAMGTDAAFRFERGIDPEGSVRALDRAAGLMAELAGGNICWGIIDQHPVNVAVARDIVLGLKKVNKIIGTAVSIDEVKAILEGLEMTVREAEEDVFLVTPPSCRVDITREIDLIEEIARLFGYDRIPATLPLVSVIAEEPGNKKRRAEAAIRQIMNGAGYTEVINYSFIHPSSVDDLLLAPTDERRRQVRIKNPLTEEQSAMRTTMLYSLLKNVSKNSDLGRSDLKIFEIGRTYIGSQEGKQPQEFNKAAFLVTGQRYEQRWHFPDLKADFYDLKGCVENILEVLKVASPSYRAACGEPFLHPGKSCEVFSKEARIGYLGEIHPDVLSRFGVAGPIVACEFDLDMMIAQAAAKMVFADIPRFPASSRDVAFLTRREIESGELLAAAQKTNEELLEKVEIFDVYEGKNVAEGTKSLGLRFLYRSADRTLTDDEVNAVHSRVVERVINASGALIR
ncbi:MAG: phenylalanine--tRNA ligase subunit beta [Syntrophales bacterium]